MQISNVFRTIKPLTGRGVSRTGDLRSNLDHELLLVQIMNTVSEFKFSISNFVFVQIL